MKGYKCDKAIIENEIAMIDKVLEKYCLKVTKHKECYRFNRYYVKLNYDNDIRELLRLRPNFSIALKDETIRLYREANNLLIEKKRSNDYPYYEKFQENSRWRKEFGAKLLLGIDEEGSIVITDLSKSPNIFVAGCPGSGKTMFMMNVIVSLFLVGKTLSMVLDSSEQRLKRLYGLAGYNYSVGSEENFRKLLNLNKVLLNRLEELNRLGLANISGSAYYPCYVIVNDIEELISQKPDAEILLSNLVEFGAKAGIHLVLSMKNMENGAYTQRLRSNIPVKVCFKTKNASQSTMIIGREGAESLFGEGDMFFIGKSSTEPIRVQAPFLDGNIIDALASKIGESHR